jgi:hypothetical protein
MYIPTFQLEQEFRTAVHIIIPKMMIRRLRGFASDILFLAPEIEVGPTFKVKLGAVGEVVRYDCSIEEFNTSVSLNREIPEDRYYKVSQPINPVNSIVRTIYRSWIEHIKSSMNYGSSVFHDLMLTQREST